MKKIVNEKKFVEDTLKNKTVSNKPSDTIRLLAKHYFHQGLDKETVLSKVEQFISENVHGYKSMEWNKRIKDAITRVSKSEDYALSVVEKVSISKRELSVISSLDNLELEKLAFVLLVHAKVNNAMKHKEGNWVNSDPKELAADAMLKSRSDVQQGKLRYELKCRGLIEAPRGNSVRVNYIDDQSEVAIIITDFQHYIEKYLKWKGVIKSKKCESESCIEYVEPSSNRQKFCAKCSRLRRNEQQKKRDKNKNHNHKQLSIAKK